jgi:CDP-diacylglycerol--glycerol-3-phosphate 3-phosphatidyltransferase
MDMKNLPNMLTAFRIGMVPLLVVFMFIPFAWAQWMALFVFILAAITDFFDGYLARKHDVQSDLGALLDPIADKFLVLAALLMLIAVGTLSGINVIAAIVILGREILVAGLREFLAGSSVKLPVTLLAKWKTSIQMISIGFLIVGPAGSSVISGSLIIGLLGIWLAAIITVVTGYQYAREGYLKMTGKSEPSTAARAKAVTPSSLDPTPDDPVS